MEPLEYYVWDYRFGEADEDGPDFKYIEVNLDLPGGSGWKLVSTAPYVRDGEVTTNGVLHYFVRTKTGQPK